MENRILIKENTDLFKEIAKDLRQFVPVLNKLKTSYEALEIGAFNNEVFKQITLLGTTKHIESYIKSLNDQLDKLGITNSTMRQNAIKDHENIIETFKISVSNAKKFYPEIYTSNRPKLTIKYISYDNGFCISKTDEEMLLESYCRIYLEDDLEIKNFELIKKLQEYFNEYLEIIESTGIKGFNKFALLGHVLKINNAGAADIDFDGFKYIATYKKKYDEQLSLRSKK